MKTIKINNKQYQECNIVMLPSSDKNSLIYSNSLLNKLSYGELSPSKCNHYYLYILSNDEIKEGDWCIETHIKSPNFNKLFKAHNKQHYLHSVEACNNYDSIKKVIAAIDTSLKLPQIPTTFIQQYISAYNNGNVIEKCLVEVEECKVCKGTKRHIVSMFGEVNCGYCQKIEGIEKLYKKLPIKLNENNEISILLPTVEKQRFSREEVVELLKQFNNDKPGVFDCTNWIEQNLK
jgi:hypothetical protein